MEYYEKQSRFLALLGQGFLFFAIVVALVVWGMFSYVFIQGVFQ